jgi:hypothetical protein
MEIEIFEACPEIPDPKSKIPNKGVSFGQILNTFGEKGKPQITPITQIFLFFLCATSCNFVANIFIGVVYLPEGRLPIIPFFQYSIIPANCERSELSSNSLHLRVPSRVFAVYFHGYEEG